MRSRWLRGTRARKGGRDPLHVLVVVRVVDAGCDGSRVVRFEVAVDQGGLIVVMVGRPGMHVFNREHGQRDKTQRCKRCGQSAVSSGETHR